MESVNFQYESSRDKFTFKLIDGHLLALQAVDTEDGETNKIYMVKEEAELVVFLLQRAIYEIKETSDVL